jgi:hypothetical protein
MVNRQKKEAKRKYDDMFENAQYTRTQIGGERQNINENNIKEYNVKYIELINNLSSMSNNRLLTFLNILAEDLEMFNKLQEVTEWENKILSEFMKKEY